MNEERKHIEVLADELRRSSKRSHLPQASNVRICLGMNSGKFRISWTAQNISQDDWVGLYPNTSASDKDYIAGQWQYASKATHFDCDVLVGPGYEARYLVYSDKYSAVARTGAFPAVNVRSVKTEYPRKPSPVEWNNLARAFPYLEQKSVWVTGPSSDVYNCIAWSLGLDDRWLNPPNPLSAFDALYQHWGQKATTPLANDATIDGWGLSTNDPKHGSKAYTGVSLAADLWESKLGPSMRITHRRQGVRGSTYGQVIVSFHPGFILSQRELRIVDANEDPRADQLAVLSSSVERVSPELRERFQMAYTAWQSTWFHGELAFTNDTRDFSRGQTFDALKAMGTAILPLVVEKLLQSDNFPTLVLYDVLQPDPDLVIRYSPEDPRQIEGEQARARRTVLLWIAAQT
jgi:hypothetical protein